METFRLYLTRHRAFAAWLIAAALLMKILVPTGYMPVMSSGGIAIEPCSGFGAETTSISMMAAMPGMADHGDNGDRHDQSGKGDMPCGFAGHAPGSMSGADPILLVVAIAAIVETTIRMPVPHIVPGRRFLRPRLRGPPATA